MKNLWNSVVKVIGGSANPTDSEAVDEDSWDDDDDDEDESLSVWDAADIWRSHGEDEDYMFGYSEDELRRAADLD